MLSKSALEDRERNIVVTVQTTRCYNCLGKLKKNGRNRKALRRTVHGEVGEAKKKQDNKNWREA